MLECHVSKKFGDSTALDDVEFAVRGGEIVALLGENGAGKSTLLNILSGGLQPSSGGIQWHGAPLHLASPREATARGIGVVHQHFQLVPVFSVAENIALHAGTGALYNAREWQDRVTGWAASLGWKIDAARRVGELSVGERQRVEIIKALFAGGEQSQLLLLDEPTANLTPGEADELFGVLRQLRANGRGLVFVSHKLNEVLALCDRVVVLRHGKVVGGRLVAQTDARELAALMVGKDAEATPDEPRTPGAPRLRIRDLAYGNLKDFPLDVKAGEIVGIAGVDGNGQAEILEILGGLALPAGGDFATIENDGSIDLKSRIAVIPPDRQREGLVLNFSIAENFALHPALRARCQRRFSLDWRKARSEAKTLMTQFDVRAPAAQENARASQLSGGNQQKVVIARALAFSPRVVVAADPTRGLDVGAAGFVHAQLRKAASDGVAILLVSTDLDEVLALSDRIGVLYEGRLLPHAALLPRSTSRETIGALMGGKENPD